jgi:hypothetical protein
MSRSQASILKKIESIESQLGKLKIALSNVDEPKKKKPSEPKKRKDKPESIDFCKTKTELAKFTIKELKEWIKENKIDAKKLSEKHKEDLVKFVWKIIKNKTESSESESSDSDSGSISDSGSESE